MGSCPAFYALWPLSAVQEPWTALTSAFYTELAAHRVVHTAAGGGQWLQPDQAVYIDGAVQRCWSSHIHAGYRRNVAAYCPLRRQEPYVPLRVMCSSAHKVWFKRQPACALPGPTQGKDPRGSP